MLLCFLPTTSQFHVLTGSLSNGFPVCSASGTFRTLDPPPPNTEALCQTPPPPPRSSKALGRGGCVRRHFDAWPLPVPQPKRVL